LLVCQCRNIRGDLRIPFLKGIQLAAQVAQARGLRVRDVALIPQVARQRGRILLVQQQFQAIGVAAAGGQGEAARQRLALRVDACPRLCLLGTQLIQVALQGGGPAFGFDQARVHLRHLPVGLGQATAQAVALCQALAQGAEHLAEFIAEPFQARSGLRGVVGRDRRRPGQQCQNGQADGRKEFGRRGHDAGAGQGV